MKWSIKVVRSIANRIVDACRLHLALIRTPTGKFHTPIIEDNQDGTVSIKYQPSEIGLHELDVFYQGQPIAGSPFKFHVDQVQTGYVTAYGPGLSHGVCNEPCNFRIITKDAGSGGLSVAVEGASKAEIQCKDNKDGTCDVTYWPVSRRAVSFSFIFASFADGARRIHDHGEIRRQEHRWFAVHRESHGFTSVDIESISSDDGQSK